MLADLEIKNFRTFKHLRIRRLGQVNLILGENNVGKTTLLEALQIYGSVWPAQTTAEILNCRGDSGPSNGRGSMLDLIAFFHGRIGTVGARASIGPLSEREENIHVLSVESDVGEDLRPNEWTDSGQGGIPWGPQIILNFRFGSSGVEKSQLFPSGRVKFSRGLAGKTAFEANVRPLLLRVASSQSMLSDTAARWDSIVLTPAEAPVLDVLQRFSPVAGITYVGQPERVAKARLQGSAFPIPLQAMGEGIARMFQIAVSLQYAGRTLEPDESNDAPLNRTPILLVDEIDSGIHHSIHADVWRFVLKAAHELGVQVFATTHSLDCLRGFAEAVKTETECDAQAIRLEKVEGKEQTGAVIIDRDDLPIVIRDSIEVR